MSSTPRSPPSPGLGGAAVKAAYSAVKKLGGNLVTNATDRLLPQFARALDPFWATKGEQSFGAHLAAQPDAAADALLAVTDAKAATTKHTSAAKLYGSLRGKAKVARRRRAPPARCRRGAPRRLTSPPSGETPASTPRTYAAGPAPTGNRPCRACGHSVGA